MVFNRKKHRKLFYQYWPVIINKLVQQKLMQKLNSGISLISGGQPWSVKLMQKKRLLTCTVAAAAGEGGWLTSDVKRSSGSVSDPR